MTLHVPSKNSHVVSLVLRRTCFSRSAAAAVFAVVSTSVVLAGRGPDFLPTEFAEAPQVASLSLGFGSKRASDQQLSELEAVSLGTTSPAALEAPLSNDAPLKLDLVAVGSAPKILSLQDLEPHAAAESSFSEILRENVSDTPVQPRRPRNIEVASLMLPNDEWSPLGSPVLSDLPSFRDNPTAPALKPRGPVDIAPEISDLTALPAIRSLTAGHGESLSSLLTRAELSESDRKATLIALRADNVADSLTEGDIIDVALLSEDDNQLLAIRVRQKDDAPVELRWDGDTEPLWSSLDLPEALESPDIVEKEPEPETLSITGRRNDTVLVEGEISSSLYTSAANAGLTSGETKALSDIFRYTVDFERDLRKGDHFEALFEKKPNGAYGEVLYAKLTNRGSEIALYRGIDDVTGEVGYFDAAGKTNKRSLMRTPVAGAQVSSHFGMRMHPVLGYSKMHRGTDFRARRGTPIFAAGDGIVDSIGRKGAYGEYIRIRHNSNYKTAYAHLSRYAEGLNYGDRVRQGDIIGYVGSTGRSTGPHLHFEILENGNQINPLKIADFGPVKGLSGAALSAFLVRVSRIEIALTLMRRNTRYAESN